MKKMNKKGFTLAELLIVVAIIAVLVAIAIPVFTAQLEKSKEATDAANLRSAYAEAVSNALYSGSTGSSTVYTVQQAQANPQSNAASDLAAAIKGASGFAAWQGMTKGAGSKFQVEVDVSSDPAKVTIKAAS